MNNNVFIMCGIPGIGKSTWIKNFKSDNKIVISRDEIRFGLLSKEDDYFAREEEVLTIFSSKIREAIIKNENADIFIDATHLNEGSRRKTLNMIGLKLRLQNKIIAVAFPNDLRKAFEQNEKREGRSKVPRGIIRRMHFQFVPPSLEEGFDKIMEVK